MWYNYITSLLFEAPLKPVEAFNLLLNLTPDDASVCSSRPVGIVRAATFVVSNHAVGKVDDLKADDLDVWVHKGKPIRKYKDHLKIVEMKFIS